MESCAWRASFIKRLAGFTLAGGVVVVFAKPIFLALLAATACAVIGFLAWLPAHTVFVGRHSAWRRACDRGRHWPGQLAVWCQPLDHGCRAGLRRVCEAGRRWLPVVGAVLLESVSGAVLGGLVSAVGGAREMAGPAVLLGAAAGAAVGVRRRAEAGPPEA
jgi:hypothetical protein